MSHRGDVVPTPPAPRPPAAAPGNVNPREGNTRYSPTWAKATHAKKAVRQPTAKELERKKAVAAAEAARVEAAERWAAAVAENERMATEAAEAERVAAAEQAAAVAAEIVCNAVEAAMAAAEQAAAEVAETERKAAEAAEAERVAAAELAAAVAAEIALWTEGSTEEWTEALRRAAILLPDRENDPYGVALTALARMLLCKENVSGEGIPSLDSEESTLVLRSEALCRAAIIRDETSSRRTFGIATAPEPSRPLIRAPRAHDAAVLNRWVDAMHCRYVSVEKKAELWALRSREHAARARLGALWDHMTSGLPAVTAWTGVLHEMFDRGGHPLMASAVDVGRTVDVFAAEAKNRAQIIRGAFTEKRSLALVEKNSRPAGWPSKSRQVAPRATGVDDGSWCNWRWDFPGRSDLTPCDVPWRYIRVPTPRPETPVVEGDTRLRRRVCGHPVLPPRDTASPQRGMRPLGSGGGGMRPFPHGGGAPPMTTLWVDDIDEEDTIVQPPPRPLHRTTPSYTQSVKGSCLPPDVTYPVDGRAAYNALADLIRHRDGGVDTEGTSFSHNGLGPMARPWTAGGEGRAGGAPHPPARCPPARCPPADDHSLYGRQRRARLAKS